MFEDKEFAIDRNSEAYRLLKPTEKAKRPNEESDEDQAPAEVAFKPKEKDFSKLFAGRDESENEEASDDGETNFEKKISKDQKKKNKFKKDKIISNYALAQRNQPASSSKPIKKEQTKLKKNAISEQDVRRKMKQKRIVYSSKRINAMK